MRWIKFIVLIFFSIPAAAAGEFSENPAFCFGFISAQSKKEADALRHHKPHIRSLFAKFGPKDSTDERGFEEWEEIGRDVAFDRIDGSHVTLLGDCKKLLDTGPN